MSEYPTERRDIQTIVSDMRADVASIKTRVELQTTTLTRIEQRLDLTLFREEYERRHLELQQEIGVAKKEVDDVRDDYLRRQGAQRVWRWVYGAAIAALGVIEVYYHH